MTAEARIAWVERSAGALAIGLGLALRLAAPKTSIVTTRPMLLVAAGVVLLAVGLARENHGAAGLGGVVAFLVATKGAEVLINVPPEVLAAATNDAHRGLAAAAYKASTPRVAMNQMPRTLASITACQSS